MCGNCHDSARAVCHKNIIGNENGYLLAVYGIYALDTLYLDAGLFLVELAAFKVGLLCSLGDIGVDLVGIFDYILPLGDILMLGRKDHIGCAEQRVGTGGVDNDVVACGGLKGDLGAGGAADPVFLLDLHSLDVIQIVQIVDKALGVLGDGEHPLAFLFADDLAAAAFADAVYDLFVCEHALAARAPVDGHSRFISKTVLVHLQEYPLRPLIVVGVCGVHAAIPVEAVAQHLELACEVCDVVFCNYGRMDVVLDGIVFRRQAECIKADGE